MRRTFALLGLSATLFVACSSLSPSRAVAAIEGPCTASIDGVDVTAGHDGPDSAIPLQSGTQVPVEGTAEHRVRDLSYTVHVAGGGVQVGSVTIDEGGQSWSGSVDLGDFSAATVGVFEVTMEAELQRGACTGVAYVCIEGRSPLTTAAGAGATAVGAGGGILLALSLFRGAGLGAGRAAVQGFGGGAAVGLGGAVLLQQFCTIPLTTASAIGVPIVLGAAGAVVSSFARRAGTRGARRPARHPPGVPAGGDPASPAAAGLEGASPTSGPAPSGPRGPTDLPPGAAPDGGIVLPPIPPPVTDEVNGCPNCGAENTRDSQFCTNCGTRLKT